MTSSIDEAVQKHMYALSNGERNPFDKVLLTCMHQIRKNLNDCRPTTARYRALLTWLRNSQHVAFLLMFDGLYPCKDRVREVLRTTPGETKRILDLGDLVTNYNTSLCHLTLHRLRIRDLVLPNGARIS